MNPNIEGNIGGAGPIGSLGPIAGIEKKGVLDPLLLSTLSHSQQEALMVLYLMNMPVLPPPGGAQGMNTETIGTIVAAGFAKIGSDMWDKYLDYLAEEKQRIADYLKSPQYMVFIERQSSNYIAKAERSSPLETMQAIRETAEYKGWYGELTVSEQQLEDKRFHSLGLWSDKIDGLTNYIDDAKKTNPGSIPFMAASFVISAAFIGDYTNIVDVASTKMVGANPIQDAVGTSLANILPQDFQEQINLTINLFVTGMIYHTMAEEVAKFGNSGNKPKDLQFAKDFAKSVIEKVGSNEVNSMLMALLVSKMEKGEPLTKSRINQFTAITKAMMIAIALALLYKVQTKWITGQEFQSMLNGEFKEPATDEEKVLVNLFKGLKATGEMSDEGWTGLIGSMFSFFDKNPSVDKLLNPLKVYSQVLMNFQLPEVRS